MTVLLCLLLLGDTLTLDQLNERIAQHHQELEQTRRQLEETQQRIEALARGEQSSLAKLEALADQIAAARRYIGQLDAQLADRTAEIVAVTRQADETADRIAARKRDLRRRLVYIYKYGLLLPVEAMLSADKVTDVSRRMLYLRWLARADKESAVELGKLEAQLTEQRGRLVAARADLERLKAERAAQEQSLEASRKGEAETLESIRQERGTKEQLEAELNQALANLGQLIAQLEAERQSRGPKDTGAFAALKGKLPWPVRGEVIARFGSQVHPEYKTRTPNKGIDIKTQSGTLVLAVESGKVAYADQFMGYGKMVIVDHGGGYYSLYSNLDRIAAQVGAAIISGSAVGYTRDYLHFELRQHGQSVDPLEWLKP